MELYLVRHGEAFSSEERFERPLNPRGKEEVELIAKYLSEKNCQIQRIFHSEKLRAIETAEIIANALGLTQQMALLSSLDPEEDVNRLIGDIYENEMNTLMVGHLPNLALVSNFLITGNCDQTSITFMPASVACFEWQQQAWTLKWVMHPSSLKNI